MNSTSRLMIAGVASLACVAGVAAGAPPGTPPLGPAARASTGMGPVGVADGLWSENFNSYAAGIGLSGQGGWAPWCSGGLDGVVTTQFASSPPKSFRANSGTDMVQAFTGANSGQWVFRVNTYVSSNSTGTVTQDGYVILLNNYGATHCPSTNNADWSVTVRFSALLGTAATWTNGTYATSLPLIYDEWVEYRAEIDLDSDLLLEYYGGDLLSTNTWTGNIGIGGLPQIAALNLYSATLDGMYYDDAGLEGSGCYPDCNNSGTLTVADFICFQGEFVAGNLAYADCNGSGTLTVADFVCFQGEFVAGCQ